MDNITLTEDQAISAAQAPILTRLSAGNGEFTEASTGNKRLDWVINTTSSTSKSIYRLQSYNAFGEVVQETYGNGNTIDMTYNTLGKLTKKQDPIANFTRANGFIETTLRPNTDYTYDAAGRMVAMQDANGNLNTQAWLAGAPPNTNDMLVFERHADGGIKTYGYDIYGNKRTSFDELATSRTNSAADAVRRTNYIYDAENRLTRIDRPMRADQSAGDMNATVGVATRAYDAYTYDAAGQRITHTNSLGGAANTEKTFYDSLGRVSQTRTNLGFNTSKRRVCKMV